MKFITNRELETITHNRRKFKFFGNEVFESRSPKPKKYSWAFPGKIEQIASTNYGVLVNLKDDPQPYCIYGGPKPNMMYQNVFAPCAFLEYGTL